MNFSSIQIQELLKEAIKEDLGWGDITTQTLFSKFIPARAIIYPKEECLLAGIPVVKEIYSLLDPTIKTEIHQDDGTRVEKGKAIMTLHGDGRILLQGERVALNFLQRLSGIASLTSKFVELVKGYKTRVLDTRKTTPGLRLLERYAVCQGGGMNHRFHLGDAVLIKDNHISLKGGLKRTLESIRRYQNPFSKIEVEVKNKEEVLMALAGRADIILLDNMSLSEIKKAVSLIGNKAWIEASGGVTFSNVREIAAAGVDFISIGALTHSAPSIDISMDINLA